MNKMESIGFRIRKVRALTGLSQEEFANQIGVSRSVLSQIEIDKIRPSLDVLSAISKLYSIPYDWLIEGGPTPDELKDLGLPPQVKEDKDEVMFHFPPPDFLVHPSKSSNFVEEEIAKARSRLNEMFDFERTNVHHRRFKDDRDTYRSKDRSDNNRSILLIPDFLHSDYLSLAKDGKLDLLAERISLPRIRLNPRYEYRAFEVPNNQLSPFLEKGDILIGYQQEDDRELVLMSLYVLVMRNKLFFGVLTGITETHYFVSHNPVIEHKVEYRKDEIVELWLVDKVMHDNFTSRFRQMQMMIHSSPLGQLFSPGYDKK